MEKTETLTFVKWAGGKGQLIKQIENYLPEKIERYFEPFVGGGALFFYILQKYQPKYSYISDINEDLINTYMVIRDNVNDLIKELEKHKIEHKKDFTKFGDKKELRIKELNKLKKKSQDESELTNIELELKKLKIEKKKDMPKRYYYIARKYFNQNKNILSNIEIAAYFIYFNKACFNGIHRVNPKGEFNVPKGDTKDFIIDEGRLMKTSELLNKNKVEIKLAPYDVIENKVKTGDFIYFDPPYHPLSKTAQFTSYTKMGFSEKDQEDLSNLYKKLDKKSCKVVLSNNNTPFIQNLYKDFKPKIVNARRSINCDGTKRGEISEVLVVNY